MSIVINNSSGVTERFPLYQIEETGYDYLTICSDSDCTKQIFFSGIRFSGNLSGNGKI